MQNSGMRQRISELEEGIRMREDQLARMRQLVRDLQAEIQSGAAKDPSALGRVKQQVWINKKL